MWAYFSLRDREPASPPPEEAPISLTPGPGRLATATGCAAIYSGGYHRYSRNRRRTASALFQGEALSQQQERDLLLWCIARGLGHGGNSSCEPGGDPPQRRRSRQTVHG